MGKHTPSQLVVLVVIILVPLVVVLAHMEVVLVVMVEVHFSVVVEEEGILVFLPVQLVLPMLYSLPVVVGAVQQATDLPVLEVDQVGKTQLPTESVGIHQQEVRKSEAELPVPQLLDQAWLKEIMAPLCKEDPPEVEPNGVVVEAAAGIMVVEAAEETMDGLAAIAVALVQQEVVAEVDRDILEDLE